MLAHLCNLEWVCQYIYYQCLGYCWPSDEILYLPLYDNTPPPPPPPPPHTHTGPSSQSSDGTERKLFVYFFTDLSKLSQVVAELARRVDAIATAQFNDATLCDLILCVMLHASVRAKQKVIV